jgi:hypothetical protein
MPKKYDYSVVLSEPKSGCSKRITVTLNHLMTEKDLITIETANSVTDTLVQNYDNYLVVTFWQLLSVTGTFTYNVVYEMNYALNFMAQRSFLIRINHKITTSTIKADYEYFKAKILESPECTQHDVTILFHQEIPDE